MCEGGGLLEAIERYLSKAEDDLEEILEAEGYADPAGTVRHISEMEEEIGQILEMETSELCRYLEDAEEAGESLEQFIAVGWIIYVEADKTAEMLQESLLRHYSEVLGWAVRLYLLEAGSELEAVITQRTLAWVDEWSLELGNLMKLGSHTAMERLLKDAMENGMGPGLLSANIVESGIREGYRARQTSITEMLRAHSVAQEESIQQNPSIEEKEWVHSGGHRIKPRENHVAISGQKVSKLEPFTLIGADGITYYPRFPRDPILPACEAICCYCVHRGIVMAEILGLSLEERRKMQAKIIEDMDKDWEKELNERNKKKAGIKQ